jgi:hypothetical protein
MPFEKNFDAEAQRRREIKIWTGRNGREGSKSIIIFLSYPTYLPVDRFSLRLCVSALKDF